MNNIELQAVKSYMILRLRFGETDDQTCFAPTESTLFEVQGVTETGIQVSQEADPQLKRLIAAATTVDRTSELSQLLSGYDSQQVTSNLLVSKCTLYYILLLDESDWKNIIKPKVAVKTPRQFIRACLTAEPSNAINASAFRFIKWIQLIPRYAETDSAVTGTTESSLLAQYIAEGACTDDATLIDLPIVEVPKVNLVAPKIEPPVKPKVVANKPAATPVKQVQSKTVKTKKAVSQQPILPTKKKKRRRTV